MAASVSLLTESELHGLVDGHIEADRRADVLRRLAASATDRTLVEAWQQQADLIRAAFDDVEREALPMTLDLKAPRLRCVDTSVQRGGAVPLRDSVDHRKGGIAAAATLLVVAVGLVGTWLLIAQTGRDEDGSNVMSQRSLDATLADRASAVIDGGASDDATRLTVAGGLPSVRLPDLTTAGFMLTGIATQPAEPVSIVLKYRDDSDGRLAVTIARMPPGLAPAAPATVGKSITWRRRDAAFAIAGTLPTDRLRAIAASLQDETGN